MIIQGQHTNPELIRIQKSIADNLRNKDLFQSENTDTADNSIELKPPISMNNCLFVFKNSAYVAKCSRVLAADIIYNDITITPDTDDPDDHLVNQVDQISDFLYNNIDELYNLAVDYYYASWCAMEYTWDNTRFSLQQIPIHTCHVIRVKEQGEPLYLLKQQINSTVKYFKIMGEDYPDNFQSYGGEVLGYASLIGGDNIYKFFGLPRWIQNYEKILTEIAITEGDYKTISNGNISSGVLNINLEPQIAQPIEYDSEGKPIPQESREDVISQELQSANGGTAVFFTESNRPLNMDYVSLANQNQSYLTDLRTNCEDAILNDYNIPKVRLMINDEKESMNSNKTQSIWEIYTLNLKTEQRPFKLFIKELIYELYSIPVNVDIATPIFTDRRETETKLLIDIWNAGALTLKQFITGLSAYIDEIDLNDYDFNVNPDVWDYRKIDGLNDTLSADDLALIEEVEAQLDAVKS